MEGLVPVCNVNLNIVSPKEEYSNKAPQKPSLKEKIIQISACALIIFGAIFLLASIGLFTSSLFIGPAAALMGETMYPLGVLSLLGGINLFQDRRRDGLKISSRLGPVTLSM